MSTVVEEPQTSDFEFLQAAKLIVQQQQRAIAMGLPSAGEIDSAIATAATALAEVNDEVVESEELVRAVFDSLFSRTFVFIVGDGGAGKTFGVERMQAHVEIKKWNTQFRAGMKREEFMGSVSLRLMQQQDLFVHNTTNMLPEAEHTLLDELPDGGMALRELLGLLNERRINNGGFVQPSPLMAGVGAGNFWPDAPELLALMDRFAQRIVQRPVQTSGGFLKILQAALQRDLEQLAGIDHTGNYTVISHDELLVIQRAVLGCAVPPDMLKAIDDLRKRGMANNIHASPRRWVDGVKLARARAVQAGRDEVILEDLRVLANLLRNKEDDVKLSLQLTAGFRDKITRATDLAQSSLDELRSAMVPVHALLSAGKVADIASSMTNPIRSNAVEARRRIRAELADYGRAHPALEAIEREMGEEIELLRQIQTGEL